MYVIEREKNGRWVETGSASNNKGKARTLLVSWVAHRPKDRFRIAPYARAAGCSCEECGRFIRDGNPCHQWDDGVVTCRSCGGPNSPKRIKAK